MYGIAGVDVFHLIAVLDFWVGLDSVAPPDFTEVAGCWVAYA